jgi:hypothetical protein
MKQISSRLAVTSRNSIQSQRTALRTLIPAGIALLAVVAIRWALQLIRGTTAQNDWSDDGPIVKALSVGEATTTTATTLRSGPSIRHGVLRIMAPGATVNVSNTVHNGFRYVVHQGLAGWMPDQHTGHQTGTG